MQLQKLLLILTGPVVGVAALTLLVGLTTAHVQFSAQSNKITSGGFAPNQVSAVLGMGVFAGLLCILGGRMKGGLRLLMFGVVVILAIQSAMTFSRGGLYMALGGSAIAALYLARDRRARLRIVMVSVIGFVLTVYVVLPALNNYTRGALSRRFESTKLTGRDNIAKQEILLWLDNPIFGVGPGMAKYYRPPLWVASHTEYSRLLAEHGIFGLAAMILLLGFCIQNVRNARTDFGKAVVSSITGWSFLFMLSIAMRLVAPSFMLGLAATKFVPDEE